MIKILKTSSLLVLLQIIILNNIFSQSISINEITYTVEQLITEVLITGSVAITDVKYTGSEKAIGYFSNGDPDILFESGIILSTGDIEKAKGPNKTGSARTSFNTPGDSDLQNLISGYITADAAVLEFNFVPYADSIKFEYIFASEEYPEFVNKQFNDIFAFFLTGKNPEGGEYNNLNIAVLPNTNVTVSIHNVNESENSSYYKDNKGGKNIQYDGLTTKLTAKAKVVSGETYHIKIAISDVADTKYDSGVFLKATSFYGGTSLDYDGNCLFNDIKFNITNTIGLESILWDFGDPNSGASNTSTDISPTHKFSESGNFTITLITEYPNRIDTIIETIKIVGQEIDLGKDFTIKENKNFTLDAGVVAKSYLWNTKETTQTITASEPGKYSVTVTFDDGCSASDTITITLDDEKCPCCLLALIFGTLMAITSLILFFICRRNNDTE